MSSQSYGDATHIGPGFNVQLQNARIEVTLPEPTLLEIYGGVDGLGITSCGVQVVTAFEGTAGVITLRRRPVPGVDSPLADIDIGTIPINATNGATAGNLIRSVFESYAENASGVAEISIPPGQSFVMAITTVMGTGGTAIPFANGYRYPSGSFKVKAAGEALPSPSTTKLFNVNITAS
jgi:hypothetical protein